LIYFIVKKVFDYKFVSKLNFSVSKGLNLINIGNISQVYSKKSRISYVE